MSATDAAYPWPPAGQVSARTDTPPRQGAHIRSPQPVSEGETAMSDAAAVHREMFESVNTKDLEQLRETLHPDYTYTGTDGKTAGIDAGIEVARAFITAMPDLEVEFRYQWSPRDDVSIIELTARGTHTGPLGDLPPTGRRVEIVGCNVVEVADGRILREREYFDEMALMRQLGVMEE